MLKIVSPTGCVHAVNDTVADDKGAKYSTLCYHANYYYSYGEQYYHRWKKTSAADVTCKRCLKVMNKKIRRKETDWTKANRGCKHRYPHLKHGVLCDESTKFRAEVAMRKCTSTLCPTPCVPSAAEVIEKFVLETITNISKELILADKTFKLRFDMIAVHCKWKKPHKSKYSQCTNPKLEDLNFGWACSMTNCPHMNDALNWRCNHGM